MEQLKFKDFRPFENVAKTQCSTLRQARSVVIFSSTHKYI